MLDKIDAIEVDFAINKDNLHLLGEPHKKTIVNRYKSIKEERVWKLKEKYTGLTVLLEASISDDDTVYMLEFYLLKEKIYSNFHFSYGPAFLLYKDGVLSEEVWYKKGEEHREDGPAVISYDPETGSICDREFYIEGEQVE